MTIQAWGASAALVAASVLVGQALAVLGLRCRAAGPAVGIAALIVIADVAIKLPGRAATAAVLLLIVVLAGAAVIAIRGRQESRPPVSGLVTLVLTAAGAAIPFVANGRVGLPGVSLDNDTANHLMWAQSLRDPSVGRRYGVPAGYPLGPHSLADAVSSGLGVRLDGAFTALLITGVVVTALVASASLPGARGWKKPIVGVLAALLYLPAAYYAEASFKETLLGGFLLAMVLQFEGLRSGWRMGERGRWRGLLPLAIMSAGAIYTYSYPALAWIVATPVIWIVLEVIARPSLVLEWRRRLHDVALPLAIAAILFVVLVAPTLARIVSFAHSVGVSPAGTGAITTSNVGNLAGALSPFEAFGIWNSVDFRFFPPSLFHAGLQAALAFGVLLLGLGWSLRRRELILPAAVLACGVVYWRASHGQSSYVFAKALVIAGPVIAVTQARGLLGVPVPRLSRLVAAARWVVAATFLALAAHSSYQALRDEPVAAPESTGELVALDAYTRGQSVLFLGATDYADWVFSDSEMSALASNSVSMSLATPRPNKVNTYGTAFDFDSVSPTSINTFTWVVTTNTTYASQPPPQFQLVRRLPMYELWRRVGTVVPRDIIESPGRPGAVLDCHKPADRALSRRRGVAAVMAPPVTAALTGIPPGASETVMLHLPAGRWTLSLQYLSALELRVSVPNGQVRMPAYVDRPGPFFAVTPVTSTGAPLSVTLTALRPSRLTGPVLGAQVSALAAVPSPDPRMLVPMRQACGRYVDWFRLQS